ncbi:transporter, major facilitator family protein [Fictibacillus macauensis ZFHKF-1]|uniref:Transporter, major facilitator family protein n=1 Tax=Fictibacillus macauensis ZFHKF-1 TaxID=1196324 RepID=I8J3S6_9BACL|nr:MFS transporter [Fictibacillus macauensis]EIT86421.1 transporter, major facilitator family protein [Fictibacillus macauensis ZFHKF-1]
MSTTAAQERTGMLALLQNRVIRTILLSVLFLQIGIWVRNFAILLFVIEKTKENPIAISLISVAEFAPIFLFSFIGGTFADRWKPRKTMISCDLLSGASVFLVLLTLLVGSWKMIFFATLLSSILSQFSQPAGMKLFKLHVPEALIQPGMAMYQTVFALFMILGPVLGTVVYQQFGIMAAIGIMGCAFFLSAFALIGLPKDREVERGTERTTLIQEMKAGFRYVLSNQLLTLLGGCFAAAGLAIGMTQPLAVFLVTERLGLPKEMLQWLLAAFGIGMILGGGFILSLAKKMKPQTLLAIGMTINAIGLIAMGFSTTFWVTLMAEFISGLFMPCIQIGINTMILQNTEEAFVGRVMGILNPLFMGAMVVMMSIGGWMKAHLSILTIYETAACLMLLGVLILVPLLKKKHILKV